MNIQMDKEKLLLEIWLTSEERDNPELRASLAPVYELAQENGLLPVVFLSGSKSLKEQTSALLCAEYRRCITAEAG